LVGFFLITKFNCEDRKHQEEEEEEVQEVKRTKKNPSKYFQHQEELNMFFFANGKKKLNFF